MMNVVIVDSGGANISSIVYACQRIGVNHIELSANPDCIQQADRVILPGVGHAKAAMAKLYDLNLIACIQSLTQPVLGICLGMQLLYEYSEEGDTELLGLIPGRIRAIKPKSELTLPHMGWNQLKVKQSKNNCQTLSLLKEWKLQDYFYFVHGYCADINHYTLATAHHGQGFTAICQKDNFLGTQFHPEKSGQAGQQLLHNFIFMSKPLILGDCA